MGTVSKFYLSINYQDVLMETCLQHWQRMILDNDWYGQQYLNTNSRRDMNLNLNSFRLYFFHLENKINFQVCRIQICFKKTNLNQKPHWIKFVYLLYTKYEFSIFSNRIYRLISSTWQRDNDWKRTELSVNQTTNVPFNQ